MKKALLIVFVTVASAMAVAHEFWLQPQKFYYTIREVANIRFLVGENFSGENWSGNRDKVQQLLLYRPSGTIADLSIAMSDNKGDSLQLPLREEGTHMVVFNSTNSFISLEPAKFRAYLEEDGLKDIALYRKAHKEEELNGKEYYQRSVKSIFQVGGKLTDDCTKPTGLPLDIIPQQNPYSIPELMGRQPFTKVRFQVLFNDKPLSNHLVKIWYHASKTQVKMDSARTNKNGWITANRYPGPYLVSCVYMERNATDSVAQWQSYWGSLSFEYSQFFQRNSGK